MKSVMEEASSIVKAVEKCWQRAGKPREFSVKIYEEPEHNFFGMTTKSAKIGIFFDEKTVTVQQPAARDQRDQRDSRDQRQQSQRPQHRQYEQQKPLPQKSVLPQPRKPAPEKKEVSERAPSNRPVWNDELTNAAQAWIKNVLRMMNLSHATFTTSVSNNHLRFQFDAPVVENKVKEQQLFRSFAHLGMTALRGQFKQGLRNLKIVLKS